MLVEGQSRKMTTELGEPIQYTLRLGDEGVGLNPFIGRDIQLTFMGKITCIECGRVTKKSFAQGFCFPCMRNSPAARPSKPRPPRTRSRPSSWPSSG